VFVKQKPAAARFSIQNTSVVVRTPEEVFSADEIAQLCRFCEAMQLDWGGLDVLREHESGRLYVVDVNKTDTGPAVVLSWRDRARATTLLSDALREMISASRTHARP
jgi:glutathione synthase/RimK-type ligase-like ATP-grasp enzyme